MSDLFVKSRAYNGHDLTLQLITNTGVADTIASDGTVTGQENTHTIVSAINALEYVDILTTEGGTVLTDAVLAGKLVSNIKIGGSDKLYRDKFEKDKDSNQLTLLEDEYLAEQVIRIYYLPDDYDVPGVYEIPDVKAGIQGENLKKELINAEQALKDEIDGIYDPMIRDIAVALGYTLE